MNKKEIIELDSNCSITKRMNRAYPQKIAEVVKQSNKSEDKFELVLSLFAGENLQGKNRLCRESYFKLAVSFHVVRLG